MVGLTTAVAVRLVSSIVNHIFPSALVNFMQAMVTQGAILSQKPQQLQGTWEVQGAMEMEEAI